MILHTYAIVGLVLFLVLGAGLLALALWPRAKTKPPLLPGAWSQYQFGYPIYALIFLSFDMEMIFMYPWAVVFAQLGMTAFLDMLVFIILLSAGIAYAWGQGGLQWE